MLKYLLSLLIPGLLFSGNVAFEKPSQASKMWNSHKGTKIAPKKTQKQQAQIDKVTKEKNLYKSAHITKPTKGLLADFKKSTKKNKNNQKARKKALTERRKQAAKSRKR